MPIRQLSDGNPDGTVLGQDSSDLIALYGATPAARRANASQAAATDAASVIVLANEIRQALVTLGAIKGSA